MLSRAAVIAHRVHAHGLDRRDGGTALVLRLGVQDTPYGSAARALAARGVAGELPGPLVWTWRGAPHVHLPGDLPVLARGLWPVSDADATARIATTSIREGARRGLEAFTSGARALRAAVTERLPKGEVSARVSALVPRDLTYDCGPCAARHVSGALLQQVGVAAGVQVLPQGRATVLAPLPDDVRPPDVPEAADGVADVLRRYVALHGPATPAHLASFLGTTVAVARGLVPEGLVEVDGPAGTGWVTPEGREALEAGAGAPPPRLTRLLPPGDPWLQARDRELVVPDPARRSAVWQALSGAGALLVDGEVAGTWRSASPRRDRLRVSVTPFAPLPAHVLRELEDEARVAAGAGRAGPPPQVEVVLAG